MFPPVGSHISVDGVLSTVWKVQEDIGRVTVVYGDAIDLSSTRLRPDGLPCTPRSLKTVKLRECGPVYTLYKPIWDFTEAVRIADSLPRNARPAPPLPF